MYSGSTDDTGQVRIDDLNKVVKNLGCNSPDCDILVGIEQGEYIRCPSMIALGCMDIHQRFQRDFQRSGDFVRIVSDDSVSIP
jgi:hypothetical protein